MGAGSRIHLEGKRERNRFSPEERRREGDQKKRPRWARQGKEGRCRQIVRGEESRLKKKPIDRARRAAGEEKEKPSPSL